MTSTDLEDRITDLLGRSGSAVDVRPDLDGVLADERGSSPIVALGRSPRSNRRRLALAAAVLVVLGLLGATAGLATREDAPTDIAAAPGPAARFPILGQLPDGLDGTVEASDGEGMFRSGLTSAFRAQAAVARAAVGRVAADGTISDIIQLAAADEGTDSGIVFPPDAPVEDLGDGYRLMAAEQEVWLAGPDRSVKAVGGPETEALVRSLLDRIRTTPEPAEVLAGLEPPAGFAVIAEATGPEPEQAEVVVQAADGSMLVVETGVDRPELAVMSAGGTATPVEVGDGEGLMTHALGLTRIAWTTPSGVTVSLFAELPTDEALRLARDVELVDEATWRDTYPEVEVAPTTTAAVAPTTDGSATTEAAELVTPTPTDHPLVGQPVPAFPGPTAEQVAGRGLVLGFGPTDRDCCVRLDGVAVDLSVADWEPEGFGRDLEGDVVTASGPDDDVFAQEIPAADLAAWSITELPTTVVAGPDGIVRAVFVGGTTVEALEAALFGDPTGG